MNPANAQADPAASTTPASKPATGWRHYFSRKMLTCVMLGFTSGLPLFMLYNLLSAWLKAEQVDLKSIGLFALVGFPYTWKFVWSPLMDRFQFPLLGRRRGWMFITQLALLAAIGSFGFYSPQDELSAIVVLAGMGVLIWKTIRWVNENELPDGQPGPDDSRRP